MKIEGVKEQTAGEGFCVNKESILAATYNHLEPLQIAAANTILQAAKEGVLFSKEAMQFAESFQNREDGD